MHSPAAPNNYRVITRLPITTPPTLVIVAAAIILTAKDKAPIPAPVKPMAPRMVATDTTARAPATTAPGTHLIVVRWSGCVVWCFITKE